jgi:hypothetical protein
VDNLTLDKISIGAYNGSISIKSLGELNQSMRKLLKRFYLKIRIYLIVLLAIVIGASYMFVYEEINDLRSEYSESIVIQNNNSMKVVRASVKEISPEAEAQDKPRVEEEAQLPSPDVEDKIRAVFGDEADNAIKVCRCESQFQADRIGDTHMSKYSYGLFQINRTWWDYSPETLLNPDENIRIAKMIFDEGGWGKWTCGKMLFN